MAEAGILTLTYVSAHPDDAARVLESISPAEAAALFTDLPARAAAPALVAMLPPRAAELLGALDDGRALGLLTAAGPQGAVAILRHIAEPRRSQLLQGLPTTTAVASQMLLGFSEDTIGAWTDPAMLALGIVASALWFMTVPAAHRSHAERHVGAVCIGAHPVELVVPHGRDAGLLVVPVRGCWLARPRKRHRSPQRSRLRRPR